MRNAEFSEVENDLKSEVGMGNYLNSEVGMGNAGKGI
jgi:hypothetical protein